MKRFFNFVVVLIFSIFCSFSDDLSVCNKILESQNIGEKQLEALPLYTPDDISRAMKSNKITAKEKFSGARIKVKAQIFRIEEDCVLLFNWHKVYLPREKMKGLNARQYITFLGTVEFDKFDDNDFSFKNCELMKVENQSVREANEEAFGNFLFGY